MIVLVAATCGLGFAVVFLLTKVYGIIMGTSQSTIGNAGSEVTPKLAKRPSDITQINDTVWEFNSPSEPPEVEIIFFHGVQQREYKDAFWTTWLSRDESLVWPKDWLSKTLPKARILSVSYDSCVQETSNSGRMDLYVLGENLLQDIVFDSQSRVGQNCPVILVGHCFGGLLMKQFILSTHKRRFGMHPEKFKDDIQLAEVFLENLQGVFYYDPPNHGTRLADYASVLPGQSPLVPFLRTLNNETARINEEFRSWREIHRVISSTIAAGFPTKQRGFMVQVVPEASSRYDTDNFYTDLSDHLNVCKPVDTKSASFSQLDEFVFHDVLHKRATRGGKEDLT